jgi:hypothetical protein
MLKINFMDIYMTSLRFLFLFLGVSILLFATVYEDAEDKQTSRWLKMDRSTESHVDNIMDRQKASRIISFTGDGTRSMYALKTRKVNKKYWLSWEMNYSEDFVIMVILETNKGKRHLIYTPGIKESYMQYGLGLTATDGKWHTYRRNLAEDLSYFDNRLKIKKMTRFVIRGSGSLDNIIIKKKHSKKKLDSKGSKKIKKATQKKSTHVSKKEKIFKRGDHTPIIKIEGESTLHIKKGEQYVEPGVTAHDEEDGEINVVSMEEINIHKDGKYSIIYMATDSDGNAASDRRYVIVGKGKKEVKKKIALVKTKIPKKKEPADIDTEQKKYEMEVWERELELREQALREEITQLKGAK